MNKQISHNGKADRALKILGYLKENTDSGHTVSQKDIRAVHSMEKYVGDKHFFHNLIIELAITLDYDDEGHKKPKDECKLIFDDLDKMPDDISDYLENPNLFHIRTSHMYYNHSFTEEDINYIINALKNTDFADTKKKGELISKIKSELAPTQFTEEPDSLPIIHEFNINDKYHALDNLKIIGQAIKDKVQISFVKCCYDRNNELISCSDKIVMSPYYVVSYNGKYYVWGAVGKSHKIHIVRADLLNWVEIPMRDEKTGVKGIKAEPKYLLEKRYRKWDDNLMYKHAGMDEYYTGGSYIRVHCPKKKGEPLERIKEDYTFLHDIIGEGFHFRGMHYDHIDYDVFHLKGDIYPLIKEYNDIFGIVDSVSAEEMDSVMSEGWTGWHDWFGFGGQDYSNRYGVLTKEMKKNFMKRRRKRRSNR